MCSGRLVALHEVAELHYLLPSQGAVTIGRRATCTIVCGDGAVSGVHCVVTVVGRGSAQEQPGCQVEDRSTNGTFVNDVRVGKGQCVQLAHGDIISLTKPPCIEGEPQDGAGQATNIRFRLDLQTTEPMHEPLVMPAAPTALTPTGSTAVAPAFARREVVAGGARAAKIQPPGAGGFAATAGAWSAEGFAQDLLLEEQQTKAKITAELLHVRRKLEDERGRSEALRQELQAVQSTLEALRPVHAALQSRQEGVEADLLAQRQQCAVLEASQEKLYAELERSRADASRDRGQLVEVQGKLQEAQKQASDMEAGQREAREEAERAARRSEHLERDLGAERAERQRLEERLEALRDTAERCKAEAQSARACTREAQRRLNVEAKHVETIGAAALRFADTLRGYVDSWTKGMTECGPEGLEFAAATAIPPPATTAHQGDSCGEATGVLLGVAISGAGPCGDGDPAGDELIEQQNNEAAEQAPKSPLPAVAACAEEPRAAASLSEPADEQAPGGGAPQPLLADVAARPPSAEVANSAPATFGMLSLMVGSQDSHLPPLAPPPDDLKTPVLGRGGVGQQLVEPVPGAKRSATMSVLVMPDFQAAFKRARPAPMAR